MRITIQLGDTLSSIAEQFGTTVEELLELNPQITDPDVIFVGHSLNVSETDAVEIPDGNLTTNAQVIAAIDVRLNGHGQVIVDEARETGLDLDLACALVEKESDGRNIFGCDHGPVGDRPPYCNQEVTPDRVQKLIDSPFMNGVGLTQLTWFTFVDEAQALDGGAHEPRNQCRVGFRILKEYIDKFPYLEALGAYNAGEADRRSVLHTYAADLAERHTKWKALVGSSVDDPGSELTKFDIGINYLLPAVKNVPYWFWPPKLDIVPDGVGAYARNKPVPDIAEVMSGGFLTVEGVRVPPFDLQHGMFCMAVINLIRRANRKTVPTLGDNRYDGGTWAAQKFWGPFMEPFSRNAVYPRGTLIGKHFVWAGDPGFSEVLDQGHVAVLMGEQNLAEQKDPNILQSHPHWAVRGLNYTALSASDAGGFYEYAVRPENWINHDVGNF